MAAEPLHILIADPHTRGGGQVAYVTRLGGALHRMGHRVVVACRPDSTLAAEAARVGCESLDKLHFARGLRMLPWTGDLLLLRRYLRSTPPDIVHVNGSQDHWACALVNQSLGHPVCLLRTRHNTYAVKNSWANRKLNRVWTDYQIVVCDVVRETLAKQPPFRRDRMTTIHNGVDADLFQPDAEARAAVRAELGYGPDHVVCGLVGRLVEAKGHVFLLKAIANLRNDYPQLRVLLLGEGPLEGALRDRARGLGVDDIVCFAGFRTDMHRCVQAIDIGVQPSIDCDTSSFSLKELMAAEKPVVASDYGGLKEVVHGGVEGLIVPAGDAVSLGSALHRLLDDAALRRRLGTAGRRRVLEAFTIEVFAQRTLGVYRRAIALHRAGKASR